jgi:hypothetical protein
LEKTVNTVNLSARYGRVVELDSKVGNIRGLIKSCNPSRRYVLITNENVKEYFVNLIEARWILKHHSDFYREITDDDLLAELGAQPKRIKGGKKVAIVEEATEHFIVEFRGIKYPVLFSAALPAAEIVAVDEVNNIPLEEAPAIN